MWRQSGKPGAMLGEESGAESSQTPKSNSWGPGGVGRDLSSLFLHIPIYEMGIIITPSSWGCCVEWVRGKIEYERAAPVSEPVLDKS